MTVKAFELDFGVVMGSAQVDGRVTQLVEILVGSAAFPKRFSASKSWRIVFKFGCAEPLLYFLNDSDTIQRYL